MFAASIPWRPNTDNDNATTTATTTDGDSGGNVLPTKTKTKKTRVKSQNQYKTSIENYKNSTGIIILQRDSGKSGTVVCGKDGFNPKVSNGTNNACESTNLFYIVQTIVNKSITTYPFIRF